MNLDIKSFVFGAVCAGAALWGTYLVKLKPFETTLIREKADLTSNLGLCQRDKENLTNNLSQQGESVEKLQAQLEERAALAEHAANAPPVLNQGPDGPWYTLLYDANATANGPSPFELANLIKPGLGTLLAKLAPPQAPSLHLRWILRGYVRPVVTPEGSHAVYTLDPSASVR